MKSNLILDERPLLIIPSLARATGLNESIILQQLHYWLLRSKNLRQDRKWVYFTYDKLGEQFPFFSKSTIRRAILNLETRGLLISAHFNKSRMDQTKWYSIDYEMLGEYNDELKQSGEEQEWDEAVEAEHERGVHYEVLEIMEHADETTKMMRPSVQHELMECSPWTDDNLSLDKAIPESTTKNTSMNPIETSSSTDLVDSKGCNNGPFQFFEQNGFGVIGGFMSEKITAWCTDLSDELVIEAMKLAVENGSKKWSYV
ncbi:DnaD domain protein [Fredinandcohnia humi]